MPLKPIPVKMERAKHPEIATRAMAIERDADSASVAQEMAEAQAAAKALGIQGINFWSAILSSCLFGAWASTVRYAK
jgi:hypothetical protein